MTLIINQSLATGIFPDKLKNAKITPIHKKESIHTLENYRPISILPTISKIFEKTVFNQLYTYFDNNNYLSPNQYGFSTEHAILEVIDRISSELDTGNTPLTIFLDLSKAFDTLNHEILLHKLKYYGISNTALSWFKSYLSNRTHYVEIESHRSSYVLSFISVPQGTILGPLLFIIYTNDIENSSDFFKFIKYADDTTLFCNDTNHITINFQLGKILQLNN